MKKTIRYTYNTPDGDNIVVLVTVLYPLIQAVIAILLLIPPIIGVVLFILDLYNLDGVVSRIQYLSSSWTALESGMSATPIYLGLMAIAGSYMSNSAYNNFLKLVNANCLEKIEEENE